ncbi:MAG: flagellar FliJ family protein [Nitrospirales bacterium]|nr:flagellar FliJ family protein [Nitrospira sp.]MDR4502276.1 flagellar FliJ family protein [Nitrospirales bacterium]
MNWSTLLRFRKQVEDVIREEVVMAELEQSREETKTAQLRSEMNRLSEDIDRSLRTGISTIFLEQRFRWLEESGSALEVQANCMQEWNRKLAELRKRLKAAYHARRIVEIVIEKKETAYMRKLARDEQMLMEEVTAHKYADVMVNE